MRRDSMYGAVRAVYSLLINSGGDALNELFVYHDWAMQ